MAPTTHLEVSIPMELRRSLRRAARKKERHPLPAALPALLIGGWLLAVAASVTAGGLIHLLPVAALIVLAIRFATARATP